MPQFADKTEWRCVRAGFWKVEGHRVVKVKSKWVIMQPVDKVFDKLQEAIDWIETH